MFRRSWYWNEHADDDLLHLRKSHQALIANSKYEIKRISVELRQRRLYDQVVGDIT